MTVDTMAERMSRVLSDSAKAQNNALQALSSLTKVSAQNRNLLARTQDAIPLILGLSLSPSTLTQTLSLSILFNLSLNPDLKQSLARANIIHNLNSILLSPSSPEAGKLAASLLCSLAMLDKNKAPFGVAGTVEVVIQALKSSSNSSAAHHLLSSLAELVQFHGNCTLAVRAGAVPALVQILQGPALDLAGSSLAILGLMARFEEGIQAIRAVDGVAGLLVDGLRTGCMVSRESAAEILVKLFAESEECLREAARKDEFFSLLADLSIRGSEKAREKAAVLMNLLMKADLDSYVQEGGSMHRI
ncbi:U-box domain-containing protein 14-like [Phoenix dactylifera]|uniref:U-box domain-containing protein 14-like n=1 Tax=Phoenix dactylifera TaxID=42345 RepID=A0A8B7C5E2_PHODC|nr:U-box domain-containing protein 14-like [Phoenix dactylifera]